MRRLQLPRAKCMVGCTLYLITLRSVGTVSNLEHIKNVSKIIMGDRLIFICLDPRTKIKTSNPGRSSHGSAFCVNLRLVFLLSFSI